MKKREKTASEHAEHSEWYIVRDEPFSEWKKELIEAVIAEIKKQEEERARAFRPWYPPMFRQA